MSATEIGISKASGFTSYFSLDQTRTLSFYRRQGSTVAHKPIDEEICKRINAGDNRLFVAIIEGDINFMLGYRASVTKADLIIYISSSQNLSGIGVRILDQNWMNGDEKIDLNEFLPERK